MYLFSPHDPLDGWIFWAAYAAWMGPELIGGAVDRLRHREGRPERAFDAGSGAIIMSTIIFLPFVAIVVERLLPRSAIAWHPLLLFSAGIAAMLCGVALRWHAVRTLGRQFSRSVAIQERHEIVTAGPYRLVRHPSYSGTLLTLLGIGLAAGDWVSIALLVVGGVAAYSYRVSVEERVLVRELGGPYLEYMSTTRRFIPWIL